MHSRATIILEIISVARELVRSKEDSDGEYDLVEQVYMSQLEDAIDALDKLDDEKARLLKRLGV